MFASSKSGAVADPKDANFKNVTMLLHGNGTNGAQNNTFLDSSTNNFTITRNGNTTQGTFTPYGSNFSNYFGGSADYLSTPASANMNIGTGDFTYETWVFPTSFSSARALISFANTNVFYLNTSGIPYYGIYLVSDTAIGSTAVALNTWSHLAFVRSGTTLTCYINGTSVGSITTASSIGSSILTNYIGYHQGGNYWAGYLSNARVVKGTAVYTGSFTPSTTPLTAISGTSLLTCQSNRFIDNSTNAFTITVNGSPSVQRFSPFSPTTAYSTSVIGGSGYFDGSGDYLTAPTNTAFNLSSGNWTLEGWVYRTASSQMVLFSKDHYAGVYYPQYQLAITSSSFLQLDLGTGGVTPSTVYTGSTAIPLNQWVHICAVKSGANTLGFVNGVQQWNTTAASMADAGLPLYVCGVYNSGASGTGYMTDARIVKGSAVYTSAFTPPTAPLTAISGTSLLLSYTNAGILDNAMMNDLETVGNAQISTSVKKYGTGSMYFDGAGDYLISRASPIWLFSGDWTMEAWIYPNSVTGVQVLVETRNRTTNASPCMYLNGTNLVIDTGTASVVSAGTITISTWQHVAATRSGNSWRIFINGTQVGSTTTNTTSYTTAYGCCIGSSYYNEHYNGYIDDLRITQGLARYTASFTAPSAPYADKG